MNDFNISNARYVDPDGTGIHNHIVADIDGLTTTVPISSANRYYVEILRQVKSGDLTIAEAD
jgi:hypothetical protein